MSKLMVLGAVMAAGCGMSDSADLRTGTPLDGFVYSAHVVWDSPAVESITVNGVAVTPSFTLDHSFTDFAASATSVDAVLIITADASYRAAITPTPCGGGASAHTCDVPGQPACADLTVESETWYARDESVPGTPFFTFFPDEGKCTFVDGSRTNWDY